MLAAIRSRSPYLSSSALSTAANRSWKLGFCTSNHVSSLSSADSADKDLLNLADIENVLNDVKAENVAVIPMSERSDWVDFMVVATGRSEWHLKNIAQALVYKAKQKQKGDEQNLQGDEQQAAKPKRLVLPSVEGKTTGKWVVIDSGRVIVHALDEKAREYYNLEKLWTAKTSRKEPAEELGKAFRKVRRINNSKRRPQRTS